MNKAIKKQIKELGELKLPALWERYAEIVGEETKAPNKTYLIRRIVAALENQAAREETVEETQVQDQPEPVESPIETAEERVENETETSEQTEDISIEQLRERYREVVGRETGSRHSGYLKWKIRQAEQGKIPVGPTRTRRGDATPRDFKVLPVRLEAVLVDKLDEAWQRQGLGSRTELFRVSLQSYLSEIGEHKVAEMLSVSTSR